MDDDQPSLYVDYIPIAVGNRVRFFYSDDYFDEGRVEKIDSDGKIYVDFFDWIECWESEAPFSLIVKGRYGVFVHGERVIDFGL